MMDFKFKMMLQWMTFMVLAVLGIQADGGYIPEYNMDENCGDEISMILKSTHQFKLQLDNQYAMAETCETRIESWYSYPNIMFYFDDLDIDCDDGYLQFFRGRYGSQRVEGLEYDVCGDDEPEGVFVVLQQVMRVKYVSKRRHVLNDVMNIVVTAFTKGYCPAGGFDCANDRCIDESLKCNGRNPCGDESDCETGLSSGAIIGIVIGCLIMLVLLMAIIVCFVCCMRKTQKTPGTVQNAPAQTAVYTAQQQSGYPSYGSATTNVQNPSYNIGGVTPSAPGGGYINYTMGQQPMYPPNVDLPAYKQPDTEESPPDYAELFGDAANSATSTNTCTPAANTEPDAATYDNNTNNTLASGTNNDNAGHQYEPIRKNNNDQPYDNINTIS